MHRFLALVIDVMQVAVTEPKEIVEKAQAGDVDAFIQLVREFQNLAYGYAVSFLHNHHEAEDVAQDAFLIIYKQFGNLRRHEAFVPWLRGIVRNLCLRRIRDNEKRRGDLYEGLDMRVEEGPEKSLEQLEDRSSLHQIIYNLPQGFREVVILHYMRCHSHQEIAAFMGISLSQVNNRLHKARKLLKWRINKMAENDLNQPKLDDAFAEKIGRLVQIQGRIIEVEFPETKIPDCLSTLEISAGEKEEITKAVVIQRLENGVVRAVSEVDLGTEAMNKKVQEGLQHTQSVSVNSIHDVIRRLGVDSTDNSEFVETGIKSIDLFCPLAKNGKIGIFGPPGVGKMVLVEELTRRLTEKGLSNSIFAFQMPEEQNTYVGLQREDALDEREEMHHYFRPTNEGPRIVYIPTLDASDPEFADTLKDEFDSLCFLHHDIALFNIWPAVDPQHSCSKLLKKRNVSDRHRKISTKIIKTVEQVKNEFIDRETLCLLSNRARVAAKKNLKKQIKSKLEENNAEERTQLTRSLQLMNFLGTPFFFAEKWTKRTGSYIPLKEVLDSCEAIMEGKYDDIEHSRFTMIGSIDEIVI